MLWDELWSACSTKPQTLHAKRAWEGRFERAVWWHWEHSRLVYAASQVFLIACWAACAPSPHRSLISV